MINILVSAYLSAVWLQFCQNSFDIILFLWSRYSLAEKSNYFLEIRILHLCLYQCATETGYTEYLKASVFQPNEILK